MHYLYHSTTTNFMSLSAHMYDMLMWQYLQPTCGFEVGVWRSARRNTSSKNKQQHIPDFLSFSYYGSSQLGRFNYFYRCRYLIRITEYYLNLICVPINSCNSFVYFVFKQRHTYFMGACTFTANPPFTVTAISRIPMYHDRFYSGPWDVIRFFDYVVFPMNFFFDSGVSEINTDCNDTCLSQHNISLIIGLQDWNGWVATINLQQLLHTMVPVSAIG